MFLNIFVFILLISTLCLFSSLSSKYLIRLIDKNKINNEAIQFKTNI
ncbi:hypothetical protein SACIG290_0040 [Staphylococcus aureus subsp. aureus CIG290]|nr:hypothetical protein SACIG290_0040 [Staphylococcus aureus subsp. aureus CIG290]